MARRPTRSAARKDGPKAVRVTDDRLDAPDGALLRFDNGVWRERVGDRWEPRERPLPARRKKAKRHG